MEEKLFLKDVAQDDHLWYMNLAGTPQSTITTADLSIQFLLGDAPYTTTGISFAAIHTVATGCIHITMDTTSFVTNESDDRYLLLITHTSDALAKWEQQYRVQDGNNITAQAADFTSSSGDGRVTDGTNPISGATVVVTLDATNEQIASLETDSNGNWGPVYGLTGNCTCYVQKSGYVQGTCSITVSGTTATGPGADVALSATTAGNTRLVSTIQAYATRMIGADLSGSRADAMILQCINDAQAMVAKDSDSPFYLRDYPIQVEEPYTEGTISVTGASTTVSLATTTTSGWPSWAANGLLVHNNRMYFVSSRTDSINIVTKQACVASTQTVANTSWKLYCVKYDLPNNWLRCRGIEAGRGGSYNLIQPVSLETLHRALHESLFANTHCNMVAIGDQCVWVYPISDETDFYNFLYYRRPDNVTSGADTLDVDPIQIELFERALDLQLCIRRGKIEGDRGMRLCLAAYNQEMELNNFNDRTQYQPTPVKDYDDYHWGITPDMSRQAPGS